MRPKASTSKKQLKMPKNKEPAVLKPRATRKCKKGLTEEQLKSLVADVVEVSCDDSSDNAVIDSDEDID